MGLSSTTSLTPKKIRPFKQQPDIEIEDAMVPHPQINIGAYTIKPMCLLSEVLENFSHLRKDEFNGRTFNIDEYSPEFVHELPGGGFYTDYSKYGDRLRGFKVIDYENINLADWCVDPSSAAELSSVSKPKKREAELVLAEISLGDVLARAIETGSLYDVNDDDY